MSTETTELQAEYSKGFDAGFKEGRKKYPVSSTPTDDIEAIKNALHRASARIGCPPGDNADADLYRELSHAAELVSRFSAHPKEVAPTVEKIMEVVDDYFGDARFDIPWDILHKGEGKEILRARLKTLFP